MATTIHSRGLGAQIILDKSETRHLLWPEKCPVCVNNLPDPKSPPYRIQLPEDWTDSPKEIRCCSKCSKRVLFLGKFAKIGWIVSTVAFVSALVFRPKTQLEWLGVGGFFWIGVLIGSIGESFSKDPIGIKWGKTTNGGLFLSFRKKALAEAFCATNATDRPLVRSDAHEFLFNGLLVLTLALIIFSLYEFVGAFSPLFKERHSVLDSPGQMNLTAFATGVCLVAGAVTSFIFARKIGRKH